MYLSLSWFVTFTFSFYYLVDLFCFRLNDRIVSANGVSLENVSHATAIQVLKNCGDIVHLVSHCVKLFVTLSYKSLNPSHNSCIQRET